jgi:hypothetical protein
MRTLCCCASTAVYYQLASLLAVSAQCFSFPRAKCQCSVAESLQCAAVLSFHSLCKELMQNVMHACCIVVIIHNRQQEEHRHHKLDKQRMKLEHVLSKQHRCV